jgi:hypothetical protein
MARPTKDKIKGSSDFLREWADFQREYDEIGPVLLPVSIGITDGIIDRHRMKSDDVAIRREALLREFEAHFSESEKQIGGAYSPAEFEKALDTYIKWFEGDEKESTDFALKPSPLDLRITRPVWIMFHAKHEAWKFSEHRQFSIENDRDDHRRNCVKICTLDDNNIFLMENRWRIVPLVMKYNLHVTITQNKAPDCKGEKCEKLFTDIIIDPGMSNQFPP